MPYHQHVIHILTAPLIINLMLLSGIRTMTDIRLRELVNSRTLRISYVSSLPIYTINKTNTRITELCKSLIQTTVISHFRDIQSSPNKLLPLQTKNKKEHCDFYWAEEIFPMSCTAVKMHTTVMVTHSGRRVWNTNPSCFAPRTRARSSETKQQQWSQH